MELLDHIVKDMLEQHTGGEEFFNHLDAEVQRPPIVEQLYKSIESIHNHYLMIVSGKFGTFFSNYLADKHKLAHLCTIVVEGGLRRNNTVLDLTYMRDFIAGKRFIFLDDSFYLGRTRDTIKAEIERLGGYLCDTYVIYDGSKKKDKTVHSLYRYYDNIEEVL